MTTGKILEPPAKNKPERNIIKRYKKERYLTPFSSCIALIAAPMKRYKNNINKLYQT